MTAAGALLCGQLVRRGCGSKAGGMERGRGAQRSIPLRHSQERHVGKAGTAHRSKSKQYSARRNRRRAPSNRHSAGRIQSSDDSARGRSKQRDRTSPCSERFGRSSTPLRRREPGGGVALSPSRDPRTRQAMAIHRPRPFHTTPHRRYSCHGRASLQARAGPVGRGGDVHGSTASCNGEWRFPEGSEPMPRAEHPDPPSTRRLYRSREHGYSSQHPFRLVP